MALIVRMFTAVMNVAPAAEGFGIRIRFSRTSPGVWLGEGWEGKPIDAMQVGARATPEGWRWSSHEGAEEGLRLVSEEFKAHAYANLEGARETP